MAYNIYQNFKIIKDLTICIYIKIRFPIISNSLSKVSNSMNGGPIVVVQSPYG